MVDHSGRDGKPGTEENESASLPDDEFSASLKQSLTAAWDKREPKWYERLAPAQKHWVDKLVAIRLEEFEAHLTALDREDSQLAHQIGEVTAQLVLLNNRLASIEKRLDELESGTAAGPKE